jgi:hypothetical protein
MNEFERIEAQEEIEKKYNRKHIDGYIKQAIESSLFMQEKIDQGVELVQEYMSKSYFPSKDSRIAQLQGLNIRELVVAIFVGIAYQLQPTLFTSVTAQLASRLKFSDKTEAIATVAELVAVLCQTDAFDILKAGRSASLEVVSRMQFCNELIEFIQNSQVLPPMVCEPKELTNNYESGYLTHNDSLILGKGNHHDGDLCLDVLNIMNKVQLKLATDFLCTVEEEPTFELDTLDKQTQWVEFKKQSYRFYSLIARYGNQFHLTHKVDKRGRIYSCGYHVTTQGTSFKKACIELVHEELIEIPQEYRL